MGAIVASIVAIARAVPAARAIFEQAVALYYSAQEGRDQDHMNEVQHEREAIVASLKQSGLTDEQVRAFHKRLITLSKL